MANINTRTEVFTAAEFAAIERNEDGRIIDDFDLVWIWATDEQKATMHGDDQSRGDDVDEELRVMMAEYSE